MKLFSEPLIPGLALQDEFVGAHEEVALTHEIEALGLSPFRFQGWAGKRLTRSFGWRYDFEDASFTRAEPIPDWLLPLRKKSAAFAAIAPEEFAHVLVIRYDPGAGIGWHRDRAQFDRVVGISLGARTIMRFRQRTDSGFRRSRVELQPRSAYLLSGEVRSGWEHSIASHDALRFSITFRSLSELGRRAMLRDTRAAAVERPHI